MPPTQTTRIDAALLDQSCQAATTSVRLRQNFNFHTSNDAPAQRLLNAMQPGSYVRPHYHADPSKDESIVVLRGRFGYLSFDAAGTIVEQFTLAAGGPLFGVDIPHGTVHTLLALETDSVFFEAKAGPYQPLADHEIAAWSPAEGSAEAQALWQQWRSLFD